MCDSLVITISGPRHGFDSTWLEIGTVVTHLYLTQDTHHELSSHNDLSGCAHLKIGIILSPYSSKIHFSGSALIKIGNKLGNYLGQNHITRDYFNNS